MPTWIALTLGLALGALLTWLYLRTRLAELQLENRLTAQTSGQLHQTFESLAQSALRSTLDTVRAQMTGDLAHRHTAIEGVVKPLSDSLTRLESQVRSLELERQKAFGSLGEQLQSLTRETGTLAGALRSPQARGRWGEITLRRVAELSGMILHCDFEEQLTRDGQRPDMTVQLPAGRTIVVDAKVPLTAYLDAAAASSEPARKAALQRHAAQLAAHVKQLSAKQYWSQFQPAPEIVVLFLPGDHFFSAALEQNPSLIEDALAQKVMIATPVTLIAILKGIAYGWNQQQLADNAEQIRKLATEFHDRIQTVSQHYSDTGRQLERTVESYNKAAASWDARLLPSLRKLRDLGIGAGPDPAPAEVIDVVTRRPRAVGE